MAKTSILSADLGELRTDLASTRLGHEILESVEANFARDATVENDSSRLASFVADLITDLYDAESSNSQNRLRLTTNLEMAADRLLALANQLRASPRHERMDDIAADPFLVREG
jgi:hypothetical protein